MATLDGSVIRISLTDATIDLQPWRGQFLFACLFFTDLSLDLGFLSILFRFSEACFISKYGDLLHIFLKFLERKGKTFGKKYILSESITYFFLFKNIFKTSYNWLFSSIQWYFSSTPSCYYTLDVGWVCSTYYGSSVVT